MAMTTLLKINQNKKSDSDKKDMVDHILEQMSDVLEKSDKLNDKGQAYSRDDYLKELMIKEGVYHPQEAHMKKGEDLKRYEIECMQAYHKKTKKDILNVGFALTPTEIIEQKIPRGVIGCTGMAKLFCHFAQKAGLSCQVAAAAVCEDLVDLKQRPNLPPENRSVINGHQLIGVELSDGLYLFDPGYRGDKNDSANSGRLRAKWFKGPSKVGDVDEFLTGKPCQIRAILPSDEFMELKTFRQLENLLASGNMGLYRYRDIEKDCARPAVYQKYGQRGME